MNYPDRLADADEPTPDDLAAIEAEWPLIETEMNLLDARVALLLADRRTTSELDWRRLRRAEHNALNAVVLIAGPTARAAHDRHGPRS